MRAVILYTEFWRRLWTTAVLVLLFGFLMTTVVAASSINDPAMWATICHTPPGHPESAQTMVIYWSAIDKCLSTFNDVMGACQ